MKLSISLKSHNSLLNFIKVSSVIIAILCVVMSIYIDIEYMFWILPLSYALLICIIGDKNIVYKAPGITVLNIVMYCRYCVTPLAYIVTGEKSIFAHEYGHINDGILLMLYEMIALMLAVAYTGWKIKAKKCESQNTDFVFYQSKYGVLVSLIALVLLSFLAIRNRYLVGGIDLLLKGSLEEEIDITEVSGLVGILWQSFSAWVYVFICSLIKKKEMTGRYSSIILIAISLGYILLTFIGQTSISRWYTVVSFCAVYFTLYKLFPEKRKTIVFWIFVPVVMGILMVSIYKNSQYLSSNNQSVWKSIKELFDITTLDSYFAGPVSINNAIYLKEGGNGGFFSIFYDIVNNMPSVNHMFDLSNATVKLYASYMGRSDQIIPLVGQSSIYFSYIAAPLLAVLSVNIFRWFDKLYIKANNSLVYVYAFSAAWVAVMNITNLTICLSWFYNRIIPLALLTLLINMLGQNKIVRSSKMIQR